MKTTVKSRDGHALTIEPRGGEVALVPGGAFAAFAKFLDPHSAMVAGVGLLRAAVVADIVSRGQELSAETVRAQLRDMLREVTA